MFSKKTVLSLISVYACAGLIVACAKKNENSTSKARSARSDGTTAGNRAKEAPPEKTKVKEATAVCKKEKAGKARNECIKTKTAEAKEAAELEAKKKAGEESEEGSDKKVVKKDDKDGSKDSGKSEKGKTGETKTITSDSNQTGVIKITKVPSEDYLKGYFQDILTFEAQSDAKLRNRELADRITNASLTLDDETRKLAISISLKDAKDGKAIVLPGLLSGESFTAELGKADDEVKGTLTCMDKILNGCDVAVAEIKVKKNDSYAKAYIIFRNVRADFNMIYPKYESGSEAYRKLKDLFINSAKKVTSGNALSQINTTSFEVVKEDSVGASRIRIKLLSYENEVIAFNGVIGYTNAGESTSEIANRTLVLDEEMDFRTKANYLKSINESIEQVVFRTNNGEGTITAELRMKKLDNGTQDIVTIAIIRRSVDVKSSSKILK